MFKEDGQTWLAPHNPFCGPIVKNLQSFIGKSSIIDVCVDLVFDYILRQCRLSATHDTSVSAVTTSAIIASIGDGHQFRNGREFTAWLGLTPADKSSGGKERLWRTTKMGDQYLRSLLFVGMTSLV